jgi:hypothetical protein
MANTMPDCSALTGELAVMHPLVPDMSWPCCDMEMRIARKVTHDACDLLIYCNWLLAKVDDLS